MLEVCTPAGETLSLQMTVPALYRAATQRRSAIESAASVLSDGRKTMGPRKARSSSASKEVWGTLPGHFRVWALRDRGVVLNASCDVQQVRRVATTGMSWQAMAAGATRRIRQTPSFRHACAGHRRIARVP